MKYTKGDWKVKDWHTRIEVKCGNKIIADLDRSDCPLVEDDANAHLIAASKDMYEALKGLLRDYSTNPNSDIFYKACLKARQALEKAEGR